MSIFPSLSGSQLIKILRKFGFEVARIKAATIFSNTPTSAE